MAENKKNKAADENLPKPESMNKENKKMSGLLWGVIILGLIVSLTSGLEGDIGEGIFLFAALFTVIFAIVYFIKARNNRAK